MDASPNSLIKAATASKVDTLRSIVTWTRGNERTVPYQFRCLHIFELGGEMNLVCHPKRILKIEKLGAWYIWAFDAFHEIYP